MSNTPTGTLANDIHDIKPPLVIPDSLAWLWWLAGALILLAALVIAWRHFFGRETQPNLPPPLPPHVRAKQKLAEALALITQPKPFCILVSDTVRIYLEERFNFRAPERTTEEFLRELQNTELLAGEQKESLTRFLESCDLVKFAKYEPGEGELKDLHQSAFKLVEETEPAAIQPALAEAVTPGAV